MPSSSSQILAADYNSIRNKVVSVMGTGSASFGYGQSTNSVAVSSTQQITAAQWNLLKYDILNAYVHQTGNPPTVIVTAQSGSLIGYGSAHPVVNYNSLADIVSSNRFDIASSQAVITSKVSQSSTSLWYSQATCTVTVTFSTATQARYFFNSGGKIRFSASRSGGTTTPQNGAWTTLLNAVGIQSFTGNINSSINFYSLTNSYQTFYQRSATTPYSMNNYKIEVSSNVADNSTGTATVLTFRIQLNDQYIQYVGPNGGLYAETGVDGTLSVAVEELKATGSLEPSGTFSITGPTYSISSITSS